MGKNLIQQRRGKGSPSFRSPSFRYAGEAKHPKGQQDGAKGIIEEIVHCQGHSSPLLVIKYEDEYNLVIAPEGVRVGDEVTYGKSNDVKSGNSMQLGDIPEGTPIYNIEAKPGDGGKFVRASGGNAKVVSKTKDKVTIKLPSKKQKTLPANCFATVGVIAGSGRLEKPILKAGNKYYKMKAKNKMWPSVSGTSMNAVDHPFGGSKSSNKGRPTQSSRHAPPGRKVGKIAPRRTGRKNR